MIYRHLPPTLLFLFLCPCVTAQTLVPRFSIEGDTIMTLTHRWSVMADDDGTFDTPSSNVSVENAQFDGTETVVATVAKGDNSVRLFRAEDGTQLWQSDGGQETETLAFTEDNAFIVTGGENVPEISVWDASDGSLLRTYAAGTSVEGMRFSPDYSLLVMGSEAGQVRVYATPGDDPLAWPEEVLLLLDQGPDRDRSGVAADGHSDVNQIEWSADGRFFFSAGRNGAVRQWEVIREADSLRIEVVRDFTAGERGSLKSVDLSTDGTLVASTSNFQTGTGRRVPSRVVVHEVATGEVIFDYTIPNARVPENVTFDPSGQIMLSGADFIGVPEDRAQSFVWTVEDVRAGRTTPRQTINWFEQEYFDFTDAADQLLISGNDGSLRLFDITIDTDLVSGVKPTPVATVGVYPNPATDRVRVDLGEEARTGLRFRWVDASGRTLAVGTLATDGWVAAPAAGGVHWLVLEREGAAIYRGRVVIR